MPGGSLPLGIFRWALGVEYRGDRYHGWQRLRGRDEPTVQAELERALGFVAAEPVAVVCAGRTDSGVHATNQIVHFDTAAERPSKAWVQGGNTQLPAEIRIKWAVPVPAHFHARFSARARTYRYLIANTASQPAVAAGQCLWIKKPIDVAAMQAAAQLCCGERDFSAVRGSSCQAASPVRTIHRFTVTPVPGQTQWLVAEVCANAFLHHMVRNLMGLLLPVGMGLRPIHWVEEVLAARQRSLAGKTETPGALYLVKVEYDRDYGLPLMAKGPFMLPDQLG